MTSARQSHRVAANRRGTGLNAERDRQQRRRGGANGEWRRAQGLVLQDSEINRLVGLRDVKAASNITRSVVVLVPGLRRSHRTGSGSSDMNRVAAQGAVTGSGKAHAQV